MKNIEKVTAPPETSDGNVEEREANPVVCKNCGRKEDAYYVLAGRYLCAQCFDKESEGTVPGQ